MRRATRVLVTTGACAATLVPAAPVSAAEVACDLAVTAASGDRLASTTQRDNPPLERMHVPEAQQVSRGAGVRVAVIDNGIEPGAGLGAVPQRVDVSPPLSAHGTMVGGLVAGPDGVAPDATLVDVKVYDTGTPGDASQDGVTSERIAAGITRVLALDTATNPIDVVNISLSVPSDDPRLRAAVATLQRETDAVVVASAGNRPADGSPGEPRGTRGNDADVYPADYPGVVAVSAVAPGNGDPREHVLPNADTDVAAPTVGALTRVGTGQVCGVGEVATSWATAEVSGVVALLRARYPDDSAAQVVARLVHTAEGSDATDSETRNPWTGAGVVQAHDALTRVMSPDERGRLVTSAAAPRADAQAPPPPRQVDLFGPARVTLLWGGLVAGSLLALAFMLRPALRRRPGR